MEQVGCCVVMLHCAALYWGVYMEQLGGSVVGVYMEQVGCSVVMLHCADVYKVVHI